ncbi:unnamed protein product [Phytophthora fragariaefolia]|uniref:Unnamed protein product n=1 Tax=Phytophthora fragariaefolia TaxID=1490495 RepID=A0A9W7CX49_9STRA|nr:unnamed protein product [Phytophthora fragariaefolia]
MGDFVVGEGVETGDFVVGQGVGIGDFVVGQGVGIGAGALVVGAGVTIGARVGFRAAGLFQRLNCWTCWLNLPASAREPIAAAIIARCAMILVRFILDKDTKNWTETKTWTGQRRVGQQH